MIHFSYLLDLAQIPCPGCGKNTLESLPQLVCEDEITCAHCSAPISLAPARGAITLMAQLQERLSDLKR